MSANSVLPPFDGIERACSSEYFAGTTLNELSECQSRLPMANRRRRSSRANGLLSLSRLETSANVVGRRWSSGRRRLVPMASSMRAEALREGELLLVGEVLVVEDQHGVPVHAGVNGGDVLAAAAAW